MDQLDPTIFMIGWEYPPNNSGGLGVACEGLTKALANQHSRIFFTLPYAHSSPVGHLQLLTCADPDWNDTENRPPFSVYAESVFLNTTPFDQAINVDDLHALPTSDLERRVDRYAELVSEQAGGLEQNIDIIHAHDWMTFPAATRLADESGKPLVAHIHSTEFDRIPGGTGSPYIHHQEYQGMQRADRVIVVSEYTKQLLIKKYDIDPGKIDVVHNGIAHSRLQLVSPATAFAPKRQVVVFMGRLTHQKGVEYFLSVAKKVLAERPEALFVVAGHGDLYYQLLVSAAGQSLSASVIFAGFLRGKERTALLDRADVFVMPSLSEPFGLVALEAAQRRTPVIISKTAGVSEVLPSALAIDFWDVQKMSSTLLELLNNRSNRQSQINNQLKDVKAATWKKAALNVKEVYRKAMMG